MPDRTRPLDFEVYEVTDVVGPRHRHRQRAAASCRSTPPTAPTTTHAAAGVLHDAARAAAAVVRRRSGAAPRSSYIGTEVFLSLVDPAQAPFSGDLRQLSVQALCTNRDLVLQMPVGLGKSDSHARHRRAGRRASGSSPARAGPFAPLADGAVAWRAISHLSLNYLSLVDATPQEGAAALRDLLELYAPSDGRGARRRQIEGVRSVQRRAASCAGCRRPGPLAFGRGLEITVEVDELAFEGGSAFLLGSVLEQLLRALRVDQFVHRDRPAVGRPGRNQPMGAAMGRETDAVAFFAALAEAPYSLRLLPDAAAARVPVPRASRAGARRCGRSTSPCASARTRTSSFAPVAAGVVRARTRRRPPRLQVRLFGLLGPNGPLPLHITEYARERLRNAGDPTLSRFLDLFHHRFLALFYRAWAQAQPHVNRDRPDDDRFAVYVGAFIGIGAAGAPRPRRACPTWPSSFTRARSSARRATPTGWRRSCGTSSACRCAIERVRRPLAGRSAPRERTYLGARRRAMLGAGAVLGGRVWDRQHKFRIAARAR